MVDKVEETISRGLRKIGRKSLQPGVVILVIHKLSSLPYLVIVWVYLSVLYVCVISYFGKGYGFHHACLSSDMNLSWGFLFSFVVRVFVFERKQFLTQGLIKLR